MNSAPEVTDITASAGAFAARREDGTVVTWGEAKFSGDSSAVQERLLQVRKIRATPHAFAAIREDGTVVTWGEPEYGGDCTSVEDQLTDVTRPAVGRFRMSPLGLKGILCRMNSMLSQRLGLQG